jgi:excisionase family DNA binding protein
MAATRKRLRFECLLTPGECAGRLRITVAEIRHLLRAGLLEGHKVGKLWRVFPSHLRRFERKQAALSRAYH